MNTTLENHVADERQARKRTAVQAFEQRYATLLPLLKASDISYLVEQAPASQGGQQRMVFFRWAAGYLYACQWPLLADGAVERQGLPVEPELLAELMVEQMADWDKWAAAQALVEKRKNWRRFQKILTVAVFTGIMYLLLLPRITSYWWYWDAVGGVGGGLICLLILTVSLSRDEDRHFPDGMTPKPPHILHYSQIQSEGAQYKAS